MPTVSPSPNVDDRFTLQWIDQVVRDNTTKRIPCMSICWYSIEIDGFSTWSWSRAYGCKWLWFIYSLICVGDDPLPRTHRCLPDKEHGTYCRFTYNPNFLDGVSPRDAAADLHVNSFIPCLEDSLQREDYPLCSQYMHYMQQKEMITTP